MLTQAQKIRDYSAMDTYVDTASLWDQAWHDSFVRNGLSDFVPPLTDNLDVLVVGSSFQASQEGGLAAAAVDGGRTGLDSGDDGGDSAASPTVESPTEKGAESSAAGIDERRGEPRRRVVRLHNGPWPPRRSLRLQQRRGKRGGGRGPPPVPGDEEAARLRDIRREHPASLAEGEGVPDEGGGEGWASTWVFDLDGISDDKASVSVARKYFKDELPPGWQSFWEKGLREGV
ncbi:hypothetical protein THAOC_25984 [Thalassiosira oceanica]|uniref:Uncharacterized protein n=1 Tax=Thalassiosira oceanica TaxID=159749 RepID=K0RKZ2_THAOC|nr:hypothetical protein THAOC_25984 [Thalassiosira oceanica]|eukprot:EJK54393.1 hypothetical protein THAOC_25984 [Thalassiosira oceanica]